MEGDKDSFSVWAAAAQHRLLRTAFLLCADHARAEDLVQEALTKVALRWRRIHDQYPEAYARQIMVRDNISWWRRHRREVVSDPQPPAIASAAEAVDRRIVVQQALSRLTPKQRTAVILRYYSDLTEQQTADAMGVAVGTVKSQTHLALRRLRETAPELVDLLEEAP